LRSRSVKPRRSGRPTAAAQSPLGEPSVIVAVAAAHRGPAFAAREAIDRIKAEAPIWKREVEGERAEWVEGTPPPSG
jgi:molybdopterin synthase catalytic subunit